MRKLSSKLVLVLFVMLLAGGACRSAETPTPPPPTTEATATAVSVEDTPTLAAPTQARVDPNRERSEQEIFMDSLISDENHLLGDVNAPVTILEFSDFKCPHCANFASDALIWIKENYVSTGLVRLSYKHIATLGPESVRAAEAAECAADQQQFWTYHDRIFASQISRGSHLDDEKLLDIAQKMDLDMTVFAECLESGRHLDTIQAQTEEAEYLGIRATPGFVINGEPLIGSQPFEHFAQLIEAELTRLGIEGQPDTGIEGLVVFPNEAIPLEVMDAQWQNCGIYDSPVDVENVLGALAHGAVWISYPADIGPEQLSTLQELVAHSTANNETPLIILAPGAQPGGPITATAWRVQLAVNNAADPRLAQFVDKYQLGPFTPEPGEPCSGGIGEPIS